MKRLAPSVFKIPADKLRAGYYSDRYFLRTRDVLRVLAGSRKVGYQFFPREDAVICGLDEAVAILKTCSGEYNNPPKAEK
jgi:nicotinate phosphoribosyltransferase